MATCGLHETDLGQAFFEGGYYYWSFHKVNGEWKISYLFLDVNWTCGESLGLNDQDHHQIVSDERNGRKSESKL
jgi:hypothetical protein